MTMTATDMLSGAAPDPLQLLTVDEVCVLLQVKKSWVYDHKNDLGGFNLGGRLLRFRRDRIQRWMDRLPDDE